MLKRFGNVCAFTGPNHPGALDAAHLYMYSKTPEHDPQGGLLLRSDLHALFDRWLITIDPNSWTIDVAPQLDEYPALAALRGQPLQVSLNLRPRSTYLERHAAESRATWKSVVLLPH
jgi:HNH endonuclease